MSHEQPTIVCATDFSETSAQGVARACALADKLGAHLHLLHVIYDVASDVPNYGEGLVFPSYLEHLGERRRELEEAARHHLESALDPQWRRDHPVTLALRTGQPYEEIVNYARSVAADMIVLGTHGRSGWAHALLGSVTEKVLRNAPCAVLAVPPAKKS